jgi:hypothetical protein
VVIEKSIKLLIAYTFIKISDAANFILPIPDQQDGCNYDVEATKEPDRSNRQT